jgi:hypothetical protein
MLHALSLGPETIDAGRSWFFADPSEAAPAGGAAVGADGQPASSAPPRPLLSADDVPVTQALGEELAGAKRPTPPALPTPGVRPAASKAGPQPIVVNGSGGQPAAGGAAGQPAALPPVDRFVVVPKEELDQDEEEESRPWFSWQTGALAAAILLLGLGARWALQPPSADSLYNRITETTADHSIGSILQADGDIHEFLNRYSGDSRAWQIRDLERDIELHNLQSKFNQRMKGLASTDSLQPIERAYLEAMNYSQLDPELGLAKLEAIVALYDRPGTEKEPTGQCLTLVRRRLAQLRHDVAKRSAEQLQLLEERLRAADALGAEDPARARTMYQAVVELYANKPWAATAVRRAREALERPAEKPVAGDSGRRDSAQKVP